MKWSGRPYHLGVLFKQKLDAIKNGLHSRKSKNEVTWSQMNHTLSLRARKKLESLWRKATKWQYFCSDDQLVNRSYGHVVSRLARRSDSQEPPNCSDHMARRVTSCRQRDSGCKFNNLDPICREPLYIATWVLKPATKISPTAAPLPVAPSFVPPPLTWVCCPGGAGGLPPTSLSCSLSQRATGLEDPRLRGLRDQPTNPPTAGKVSTQRKIHSQLEYSTLRKILLKSRDLCPQGIFLGLKKMLTWEKATGGGLIFQH